MAGWLRPVADAHSEGRMVHALRSLLGPSAPTARLDTRSPLLTSTSRALPPGLDVARRTEHQLPAWHQIRQRTDPSSRWEEARSPPVPESAEGGPQAHQPDGHQITDDRDALHMAPPERHGDAPDDPG